MEFAKGPEMKKRLVIYILILLSDAAFAQWEYGGKTIGYVGSGSDDIAAANVGNGATIVVWNRPNQSNYDLRAQYVDLVIMEPEGVFKYVTLSSTGPLNFVGSKIDMDGNQYWPNEPYITGLGTERENLLSDGYGGIIALWDYYGQVDITRVYEGGHVGGDTTTSISSSEQELLPKEIKLYQNYLNPFNAQTTIIYNLSQQSEITVAIYNLLGQKNSHAL